MKNKMNKYFKKITLLFVCLLTSFTLMTGCSRETPEEEIKNILVEVEKAIEEKNVSGFMSHISENYSDEKGNDYKKIKQTVFFNVMSAGVDGFIKLSIRNPQITIKDNEALVKTGVIMARGRGDIKTTEGTAYEFQIIFKKEDDKFKVTQASWEYGGLKALF